MHTTSPEMTHRLIRARFPHLPSTLPGVCKDGSEIGFILTEILAELPKGTIVRKNPHTVGYTCVCEMALSAMENPCDAAAEVWLKVNGRGGGGVMLGSEHDDRIVAHDRVNRYYEIMGQEPLSYDDPEYRERFYDELAKIEGNDLPAGGLASMALDGKTKHGL